MALTSDQITFLKRALPHFMAGKTAEEAMRAVVDDDVKLFNALHENRIVSVSEGAAGDGRAMPNYAATERAETIRSHITQTVYKRLRA